MNEILSSATKDGFRVVYDDRVKTSASSKGNQIKWRRPDGFWAKADDMGYEGLAEQTTSLVLAHSNFTEYAEYASCRIYEDDEIYTGCVSLDFLAPGETLITLARLFEADVLRYDRDMERMSASERLRYLIENTERITGITGFGKWLGMLFELDCFILNEDRHLHNIAVVKKPDGTYKPMPVFDNGAAFLSDTTRDYPMGMPVESAIRRVKSKPIVSDFDKQLVAVRDVVGLSLKFNCSSDVMLEKVSSQKYSTAVVSRVRSVISYQVRKYPHLFSPAHKSISADPLVRD